MTTIQSKNPYTGEINAEFSTIDDTALLDIIDKAQKSYDQRKKTDISHRKKLFLRMADILEKDIEHHARLETIEMGRIYTVAVQGLRSTISLIRWFANNTEKYLAHEDITDEGLTGHIQYDPIGVIYGIAPWNFPYNQLLRAAVPNILAGNTQIYKHASNVPLCAEAIEKLFIDAGFPEGVYTNLFISTSQSELIIAHPSIQGVNLTGSERSGAVIGSMAGKYLKRSILELGGNDAFVLLDHNDTDAMIALATTCRLSNAGQKCNASKRFIILEKHYDMFVEKLSAHFAGLQVGDPMDKNTHLGPLATQNMLLDVDKQVQETILQGAKCTTGGYIVDKEKNLYAATVLADVTKDMVSYQQEVFGPVASIIKSRSVEESIFLANASDFGLSAVVYGDDLDQCKKVAQQLDGGMIFINQAAGSKASLPFGGVRKSGYGKENGPDGLRAFTNKKAILY